jgi:hypothetical protein
MKASKRLEVSFSTESWEVPIRHSAIVFPEPLQDAASEPVQDTSVTDDLAVGILLLLNGGRSAA